MQKTTAIKFTLRGKSAFFKKPDANTYAYFTYNNIHKIALLGLLGAIAGYGGYTQQIKDKKGGLDQQFPEFYSKLKDLKVCIIPNGRNGYFSKKIQQFNNSVGYASQEEGGNLIVREQWLEEPSWTIYLLKDGSLGETFSQVSDNLLNSQCVFVPYLGKNDHPAVIEKCTAVALEPAECDYFSCLIPAEFAATSHDTWDDSENGYIFKEFYPYTLDSNSNFYEYKEFVFTNYLLRKSVKTDLTFIEAGNRLMFY